MAGLRVMKSSENLSRWPFQSSTLSGLGFGLAIGLKGVQMGSVQIYYKIEGRNWTLELEQNLDV